MRPRKGTKTYQPFQKLFHILIYKDETPEGDENSVNSSALYSAVGIYKDETPEGDENYQIAPFSTLNSKHL